jgi:CBS-domain-containing membrane protein
MTGTFNINNFAVQNSPSGTPQLVATGNLVATLTNATGQAQTVVMNNVAAQSIRPERVRFSRSPWDLSTSISSD